MLEHVFVDVGNQTEPQRQDHNNDVDSCGVFCREHTSVLLYGQIPSLSK